MRIEEDTSAIVASARAHTLSYIEVITSRQYANSLDRGTKMSEYYFPTITYLVNGAIGTTANVPLTPLIAGAFDRLEMAWPGATPSLKASIKSIQAVSANSAIVWIALDVQDVHGDNAYFFRRQEDGKEGYEGAIIDSEGFMCKELSTKFQEGISQD